MEQGNIYAHWAGLLPSHEASEIAKTIAAVIGIVLFVWKLLLPLLDFLLKARIDLIYKDKIGKDTRYDKIVDTHSDQLKVLEFRVDAQATTLAKLSEQVTQVPTIIAILSRMEKVVDSLASDMKKLGETVSNIKGSFGDYDK